MYSYFISIFRDTCKLSHISNRVEDDGWDKMLKWQWSSQVLTVAVRVACLQGTLCGVPISIRPLTTTPTTWKTTPLKQKSTVKVHPGCPSKNSKFGLLPNVIPLYPTRVYEGWVSSTWFTILYLRTCFLMMWERQMYIWQKSFFVSHYFGAIIRNNTKIFGVPLHKLQHVITYHMLLNISAWFINTTNFQRITAWPPNVGSQKVFVRLAPKLRVGAHSHTRSRDFEASRCAHGKRTTGLSGFQLLTVRESHLGFWGESGNLMEFRWSWTPKKNDIRQRIVGYCRY